MAGEGKEKSIVVGGVSLSQRDIAVVAAAWQCIEEEPKVDYQKLTTLAGYGSVDSTRACWRGIKKRLLAVGTADGSSSSPTTTITTTTTTPKKSSAKKASGKPTTTITTPSSTVKSKEEDTMNIDELSGPNTPVSSSSSSSTSYSGGSTSSKATPAKGKKRNRPPKKTTPRIEEGGEVGDGSPRKKKGRITTIKAEFDRKEAEEAALHAVSAASAEAAGDEDEVGGEEVGHDTGHVKISVGAQEV